MLTRYGLSVNKEEAEKVDTLRFTWKMLLEQAQSVTDVLVDSQPEKRAELLKQVLVFKRDCVQFYDDYDQVSFKLSLTKNCFSFSSARAKF